MLRVIKPLLLGAFLFLAACGDMSQEDVVSKLKDKAGEMPGYRTNAAMEMKTGEEEQKYDVEIWHKKGDFYRVQLDSEREDKGEQVILKNANGVFVLTPSLNKSFKFQSNWPEETSQPYLYESLIRDIENDEDSTFTATENYYKFETKTNYHNRQSLPTQEIYFDKKELTPVMVQVLDEERNTAVEVQFSGFEKDDSFKDSDFDVESNMAIATAATADSRTASLEVLYPLRTFGAELTDSLETETVDGKRVILTYGGEKGFTLVQEKDMARAVSTEESVQGEVVTLKDGTVGAIRDGHLQWQKDGTSYHLASETLNEEEMIEVAASVEAKAPK
ncbi:LolA family protein [Salimicrobium halophilum]|uniref:Outer membrane lipoprotein-sorting protein n=1 Tax=Salimicrobium halophilum TaxID=86666 RepID=A0A1G8VQ03_9BACI|nr:DUF4367 domain-containing protein [Salimicrobium halophilum]SDJ68019.1 Outer membrane lipoprotein-sorting protein [Salimicrobium halophilum]